MQSLFEQHSETVRSGVQARQLDDWNTLFTTPHPPALAQRKLLTSQYIDAAVMDDTETKNWENKYSDRLRTEYLQG